VSAANDQMYLTVIPGRHAVANPESSKPPPVITGFRVLGPFGPRPGMTIQGDLLKTVDE
jgi:hypothetical protein